MQSEESICMKEKVCGYVREQCTMRDSVYWKKKAAHLL